MRSTSPAVWAMAIADTGRARSRQVEHRRPQLLRHAQALSPRALTLIAVGALTVLGALLRWRLLAKVVIWEDEITTAQVALKSFRGILDWNANFDAHPPLYHLVTHVFLLVLAHLPVAQSDVILGAIRYPSMIAGTLTIPVAYLLGAQLHSRRAGVLAAALVALSPMAGWYSREGRMYAMVWFFVLLSYWLMLRARGWWVAAYGLSVALALWTDYSAALALIPQAAYLLYARRWAAFAGYTVGWILFIPWLPSLRLQLATIHGQTYAAYPPGLKTAQVLLLDVIGGGASYASLGQVGLPILALAALLVIVAVLVWKRPAQVGALLALTAGPILVAGLLLALGNHAVLAPRVIGIAALGLLVAAGVAGAISRWGTVAVVALLVANGAALLAVERDGSSGANWDVAARQLASNARPADGVVYYPEEVRLGVEAYLPGRSWLDNGYGSWPLPDAQLDAQLETWSQGHPRLWLVYLASTGVDAPEHDAYLQAHGFKRLAGDPAAYSGVLEYATPAAAGS